MEGMKNIKRKIYRWSYNLYIKTILIPSIYIQSPDKFTKKDMKFILNKERRLGLLEGSIISDSLYIPNNEGTDLEEISAKAGEWIATDFLRVKKFGKNAKEFHRGKIYNFLISEIGQNSKDKHTSTYLLDIFDLYHAMHFDSSTIEKLIETEQIEEKPYGKALGDIGFYNFYEGRVSEDTLKKPVYQVTPKGNTLIFLRRNRGNKKEKLKKQQYSTIEKPIFAS